MHQIIKQWMSHLTSPLKNLSADREHEGIYTVIKHEEHVIFKSFIVAVFLNIWVSHCVGFQGVLPFPLKLLVLDGIGGWRVYTGFGGY